MSTVTTVADDGPGSLRQAIEEANHEPGHALIDFNIPGAGVHTITPMSPLPPLKNPAGVTLDGYSQPGASPNTLAVGDNAVLLVELSGSSAGAGANGLMVIGGNTTVDGLVVNNFDAAGIALAQQGNNTIVGDFLGTDPLGREARGNNSFGLYAIGDAPNNAIGGPDPAARNVISGGRGHGLRVDSPGNVIAGNYVGVTVSGTEALGNAGAGVIVTNSGNTVGGTAPGAGNVIAANGEVQVLFYNSSYLIPSPAPSFVQGNVIGLGADGTTALGRLYGIYLALDSRNIVIGGSSPDARNIISDNGGFGIILDVGAADATIQGNYIGTDVTGMLGRGNRGPGIYSWAPNTTVIGNVISANMGSAVLAINNAKIQGNTIGLDRAGDGLLPNVYGVVLDGSDNVVGGTAPGARNIISGNGYGIIVEFGGGQNLIQGNYIGTDSSGRFARGNSVDGVVFNTGAHDNTLGGISEAARNIISASGSAGVHLLRNDSPTISTETTENVVAGNYIGTDASGTSALGNRVGIYIENAPGNIIGASSGVFSIPAGVNVISGNVQQGVLISGSDANGNVVQGNYIGTDATGVAALGNGAEGIRIASAYGNLIGGIGGGHLYNIIAGNGSHGISLVAAAGNQVLGNSIGAGRFDGPLGNGGAGVSVQAGSRLNEIGESPLEGNFIANNAGNGVEILGATSTGNRIRANAIFANGGLGIDLGGDGVTPNHPLNPATGPNRLQNYPVLSEATIGSMLTVTLSFDSAPNVDFVLDFFASTSPNRSGFGEGEFYLGEFRVNLGPSGGDDFILLLPTLPILLDGHTLWISATATDSMGNTSEFSRAVLTVSADAAAHRHTPDGEGEMVGLLATMPISPAPATDDRFAGHEVIQAPLPWERSMPGSNAVTSSAPVAAGRAKQVVDDLFSSDMAWFSPLEQA